LKICHADTIEAAVVGFTGTARHLKALVVRLPDGRVALSQRLTAVLSAAVAARLVPQPGRASAKADDSHTAAGGDVVVDVVVDVVAGTTRHAVVTVVRPAEGRQVVAGDPPLALLRQGRGVEVADWDRISKPGPPPVVQLHGWLRPRDLVNRAGRRDRVPARSLNSEPSRALAGSSARLTRSSVPSFGRRHSEHRPP
jgi:hypothetical protein